jgi:hypothetical protein
MRVGAGKGGLLAELDGLAAGLSILLGLAVLLKNDGSGGGGAACAKAAEAKLAEAIQAEAILMERAATSPRLKIGADLPVDNTAFRWRIPYKDSRSGHFGLSAELCLEQAGYCPLPTGNAARLPM